MLPQQREHLADLHVAALETTELGNKAPRLAAGKLGVLIIAAQAGTRQHPAHRAVRRQRAARANSRHGGREAAGHGTAA